MAEVGVPDNSWRTQQFRQRVRQQIEEAMRQAGNPTNKTCIEMENHVFQKAKSRDEYLALVARLILHVRDINSKKEKGRMEALGPGGMQDPINALQNLTKTGMGPGGPQGMQMQMPQGMQPGMQHTMQQGMPQGMQPGMQQGVVQGMQGIQPGMQQGIPQGIPQGMQQGIPQGMQQGMQQGIPPGMQQGMHQGIPQPGMPQQGIPQQGMPQGIQQVIPQSIASTMVQSMPQQMQQMQPGMQHVQQQIQQRAPFQTYQQQVQAQQAQAQMQAGLRPNMAQANMQAPRADFMMAGQQGAPTPASTGAMTQVSQSQQGSQSMQQSQNQQSGPGSVSSGVPSPAPAQSNSGPIPSPANMLPSPSPGQVAPSPASRASMGVASPGSALNTPGNPNSVAPSPGSRTDTDEQTYLEKWKQLQKYIEPLKRMINRIDKDEDRRTDLSKMENLLFILSDSSKRLPYATLLKCEQVLVKQDFQTKMTPTPPVTTTKTEQHMCQPLLDAVAQHIQSPTLNHTLKRTFGTAVQALHGTTNRPASPPTKKLKNDDDQNGEVSNVLQGEIARLDHRFKVNLDPLYHNGSKTVHLICKLDDKNLPSVPPITVTVPENYPDSSPTCDTSAEDYDTTPFLRTVQKTLSDQLLKLPEKYSVTALLDTWEMSVRQACAPVSSTTK